MPKKNPLNLNPLQLKTLTLMQHLARQPETVPEADGSVRVGGFAPPHGDHFHLGDAVVMTRDATGMGNRAVWVALERKGLIQSDFPDSAVVTPVGLEYETGLAGQILHRADH